MALRDLIINIKTAFDDEGVRNARRQIADFAGPAIRAGGVAAAAGFAVVGTAIASTTINAVQFADETNTAMEEFRRQTDLAADETERYKQVALDVFGGQFGESIGDVAQVMAEVRNQTGASGDELQGLTEKALALRDRFDIDVAESLRTIDSLLKNNVVNSADEAFDTIVAGMTEGLNKSDDLLDTLNEYAQDFGSLGFTARDTLSVIQSGLDAGIFNTDRIGDALNEAFINLRDPGVIENLGEIDQGLADIARQVAQGDIGGAAAFEAIQERLRAIEDPLARNTAGVEIYRSMWEDLGEDAILALGATGEGLDNIAGASDRATETTLSLQQQWQNLGRDFMIALEPAAQELIPLLAEGIEAAGVFLRAAAPVFAEFAVNLRDTLGPALSIVGNNLARVAEVFGLAEEGATGMDVALKILDGTLSLIVTGIQAVAVATELLADAIEQAAALADQLDIIQSRTGAFGELARPGAGGLAGLGLSLGAAIGGGFQSGGVVPGQAGQARLAVVHGGEVIANPNEGQSITIGGEMFAVHAAGRLAAAINAQRQADLQMVVDTIAASLS